MHSVESVACQASTLRAFMCVCVCVCVLCALQTDSDGNVLDGPETVSDGLADLSARDRKL